MTSKRIFILASVLLLTIFSEAIIYTLSVNAAPLQSLKLTIQPSSGSGLTTPNTGVYTYARKTKISVSASASPGWLFDHWVLDESTTGSVNPITVTMNSAHTLQAVFTENPTTSKPYTEGIVIRDSSGSLLRLHGFNIDTNKFTSNDIQWIKEKGYNSIRVNMKWSSIEPGKGQYEWSSLDDILAACQSYGVWAIIDFQQWEWSPYFTFGSKPGVGGGVGFPTWLMEEGGYTNDATGQQQAYDDFYLKRDYGVTTWQEFTQFWTLVINRYKDNPYVLGYEVINEPMVGSTHINEARTACMDRYREIIPMMRSLDPNTIIILHYIDNGYNQDIEYSNIVWTKSLYKYNWSPTNPSKLDNYLYGLKEVFNNGMQFPFIFSEIGVQPTDEVIAEEFLTTAFTRMKAIMNDGVEGWSYYQYALGAKGGYQGPRNADGSDSWVQPILAMQLE